MQSSEFSELLWQKGRELYRPMPWRTDTGAYYVLVSELMLQQTQVARVIPKFEAFITRFPDVASLSAASLADVLMLWQGLGYNRRAKYLHDAAKMIMRDFAGSIPADGTSLRQLPGVGVNTAGAILAYSFNQPAIFIETNIRTVYLHHFFNDKMAIDDSLIRAKLIATLDEEHPREFYWALMDYGSWLKVNGVRNVSQSKHYKKQSPLHGSVRQVRGRIIAELGKIDSLNEAELALRLGADQRFEPALAGLLLDGLIKQTAGVYHLTK